MAETISTNQFKNGMHVEVDGTIYRIVDFQHVKPGKGGAFVRTKLKALESGGVVDKTFRAGEKMPRIHTEVVNVTYLYNDGSDVHLMNSETFDQLAFPADTMREELQYMRENDTVQLLTVDGKPTSLQLPAAVGQIFESEADSARFGVAAQEEFSRRPRFDNGIRKLPRIFPRGNPFPPHDEADHQAKGGECAKGEPAHQGLLSRMR